MSILYNIKIRQRIYQISAAVVFFTVCYAAMNNAFSNLEKQGIATGFGFLAKNSSFDVIMHLIPYSEESTYARALLVAILNTILVSICGIIISTIIGFTIGIARLSSNFAIRFLASLYIEVFRNIPLLLQIFCWYFGILRLLPHPRNSIEVIPSIYVNIRGIYFPHLHLTDNGIPFVYSIILSTFLLILSFFKKHLLGTKKILLKRICLAALPVILCLFIFPSPFEYSIPVLKGFNFQGGNVVIPEFIALMLALSIYTAAFIAELVRGGIDSVNKGQKEAAQALGLNTFQMLRFIVIPQAMRIIIPPLTNQYLNLTKNSSLGAAIAYPELVSIFAGTVLNQTGQAIEVIGITMAIYLSLSLGVSAFMNWFNKRMAIKEK